ncbi:hypothetical protein K461DRAFT_264923 [Myriangium duriaei CBS 260.36]|uniref:Wings apart-like protein C-terminal domain-containing protein n=1 Tax=Myriangium duriaei CBS 260.36 TaxID=1168546 RepID=A0A9P4JCL2_9PEZI|nr:hypothetical protein K461DRAFT_264923 [Myriangium duriaei CBS 260.36]
MVAIFGFSDADGEKRKSQAKYGKLSRPASKLSHPSEVTQGKPPPVPTSTSKLPSRSPVTKPTTRVVRDEFEYDSGHDSGLQRLPGQSKALPKRDVDEWDIPSEDETSRTSKAAGRMALTKKGKPGNATLQARKHSLQQEPQQVSDLISPSRKRKRADAHTTQRRAQATALVSQVNGKQARAAGHIQVELDGISHPTSSKAPTKSLREGQSAPARLADMLEEVVRSPVRDTAKSPQRRIASHMAAKTPPRQQSRTRPSLTKSASLTPKQSQLWNQLLDHSEQSPMDSHLVGRSLDGDIPKYQGASSSSITHPALKPNTTTGSSRPRLADRLKQDSQLTTGESSSDEDELSDGPEDTDSRAGFSQGGADDGDSAKFASQNLESTSSKHTYSQTRSYLKEVMSFEESLLQPLTTELPDPMNKAKLKGNADLEFDDEPSQTLRSVHELRAAGSKKRFVDDMEAIIDDIKDHTRSAWSRRRSALMELSQKLLGSDFALRFAESSYATVITKELRTLETTDQVADTILLVIIAQLTYRDMPLHLVDDLRASSIVLWLSSYVGNDKKPSALAKDRVNNMSKMSQESYLDFMRSIKDSTFWGGVGPNMVGSEVLALKALQGVLLKTRKTGQRQPVISGHQQIEQLVLMVRTSDASNPDQDLKRHLALSILEAESTSMASQSIASTMVWTAQTIADLVRPFSDMLVLDHPNKDYAASYLRLLLNVTNNQPGNCASFASTNNAISSLFSYIAKSFAAVNASEDELDLLLLSLGLAINLAEHSDTVRQYIPPPVLDALTQTYVRGEQASSQASSLEQSRINVAHGYLAILLANLCLNDGVKTIIKAQLPGQDIEMLVRSVEEFLGYHRRVDSGEQLDEELAEVRDENWGGFTERLGAVVERLRR